MDTITTIQSLLASNGSAQPVTVVLMPSEAALIAAAPELLEALERLHRNFHLMLAGRPVRDVAETDAEVRAAISKAHGELSQTNDLMEGEG